VGPVWAQQQDDVFAGAESLERAALVQEVLARNPDLKAGRAMVEMAKQRVPQVTALMDPMLSVDVAPASLFGMHRPGVAVRLEQQFPFPGKRALEGDRAEQEAQASAEDLERMRLEMALAASTMFDDWYQVHRALEVNAHHLEVMTELKLSAELQYGVGMGSQQDPLKAEVELARMERERIMLEAERVSMRARINAMLHRAATAPLPPPPAALPEDVELTSDFEALREEALRNRPELKALRARLGGSEAMVALAQKAWLPDLGVMAEYNSMFEGPHQYMAGVMVNLPIQVGMRRAMKAEADADRSRIKYEEQARIADIAGEVSAAIARLDEARAGLRLYRERLVPTARDQLAAARVSFESGRVDFMALIEAENNLRELEFSQHAAVAEVSRRRAALERALGRIPGAPAVGGES